MADLAVRRFKELLAREIAVKPPSTSQITPKSAGVPATLLGSRQARSFSTAPIRPVLSSAPTVEPVCAVNLFSRPLFLFVSFSRWRPRLFPSSFMFTVPPPHLRFAMIHLASIHALPCANKVRDTVHKIARLHNCKYSWKEETSLLTKLVVEGHVESQTVSKPSSSSLKWLFAAGDQ